MRLTEELHLNEKPKYMYMKRHIYCKCSIRGSFSVKLRSLDDTSMIHLCCHLQDPAGFENVSPSVFLTFSLTFFPESNFKCGEETIKQSC